VEVDNWKPEQQSQQFTPPTPQAQVEQQGKEDIQYDQIPF